MAKLKTKKNKNIKHKKILKGGTFNNTHKCDTLINCSNKSLYFNNIKGTCWMISVFMILLINNIKALTELNLFTADYFNTKLQTEKYRYLKKLPNHFFTDETKTIIKDSHKTLIINFFLELKQRLCNKTKQSQIINSKKRQRVNSIKSSHISIKPNKNNKLTNKLKQLNTGDSCEYKLGNYLKLMFDSNHVCNTKRCGSQGKSNENLLLIISILLCNSMFLYEEQWEYIHEETTIDSIIGIYITIPNHAMSFYKCNDSLMFCSNNFIVKYNWYYLLQYLYENNKYNNNTYMYDIYYNCEYEQTYSITISRNQYYGYNNGDYKIDDTLIEQELFVIVKYNKITKLNEIYKIVNGNLSLIQTVNTMDKPTFILNQQSTTKYKRTYFYFIKKYKYKDTDTDTDTNIVLNSPLSNIPINPIEIYTNNKTPPINRANKPIEIYTNNKTPPINRANKPIEIYTTNNTPPPISRLNKPQTKTSGFINISHLLLPPRPLKSNRVKKLALEL